MNDNARAELAIKKLSPVYDEIANLYEALVDEDSSAVSSSVLAITNALREIKSSWTSRPPVNLELRDGDGS
jgi:hypothetical protein